MPGPGLTMLPILISTDITAQIRDGMSGQKIMPMYYSMAPIGMVLLIPVWTAPRICTFITKIIQ